VTHVVDGSPADEAGLREDDIVIEFDGEIIRGPVALTKRIHAREPGDRSTVKVIRDGGKKSFEVELGERSVAELGERSVAYAFPPGASWDSDRWKEWQIEFKDRMEGLGERLGNSQSYSFTLPEGSGSFSVPFVSWGRPKLGVELVETTTELRQHMGGSEDEGVLVSKVLEGTPAARSGIQVGDLILSVDGESVATVGELREALDDKTGGAFPVQVVREGRSMTIDVTIPEPDNERPTGPRAGLRMAPPAPPAPPAPGVPVFAPAPALPSPPLPPMPPLAPAPPVPSVGILV
jgi:C-terminal processing protease CtpA/Prc